MSKKNNLKELLSPLQYQVTQECGTEPPFSNEYWDHHAEGIYVDITNGEPLFSSLHKFNSHTGWPSFTKPLNQDSIQNIEDSSHGMVRNEVKSKLGHSHLGHVFDDGPKPLGRRYCINSAALKFIPLEELKNQGYGNLLFHFKEQKKWEEAVLAGGCFWGLEHLLKDLPGVFTTEVGYTGGNLENPSYRDICTGKTGHAEAVRILFDPKILPFKELLFYFFKIHDPTTLNRQENDQGTQYRSSIFHLSSEQKKQALEVIQEVQASKAWKKPIVTSLESNAPFWAAENEHQDYLLKNPTGYQCHFVRKIDFGS